MRSEPRIPSLLFKNWTIFADGGGPLSAIPRPARSGLPEMEQVLKKAGWRYAGIRRIFRLHPGRALARQSVVYRLDLSRVFRCSIYLDRQTGEPWHQKVTWNYSALERFLRDMRPLLKAREMLLRYRDRGAVASRRLVELGERRYGRMVRRFGPLIARLARPDYFPWVCLPGIESASKRQARTLLRLHQILAQIHGRPAPERRGRRKNEALRERYAGIRQTF